MNRSSSLSPAVPDNIEVKNQAIKEVGTLPPRYRKKRVRSPIDHFKSESKLVQPSQKKLNKQADTIYAELCVDAKGGILTDEGKELCKDLKINPSTLIAKQMGIFMSEYEGDQGLAELNYRYYEQRRVKNLLRIHQFRAVRS